MDVFFFFSIGECNSVFMITMCRCDGVHENNQKLKLSKTASEGGLNDHLRNHNVLHKCRFKLSRMLRDGSYLGKSPKRDELQILTRQKSLIL